MRHEQDDVRAKHFRNRTQPRPPGWLAPFIDQCISFSGVVGYSSVYVVNCDKANYDPEVYQKLTRDDAAPAKHKKTAGA